MPNPIYVPITFIIAFAITFNLLRWITFHGDNVYHEWHPSNRGARHELHLFLELKQNPYFHDRVSSRASLEEILTKDVLNAHNVSTDVHHWRFRVKKVVLYAHTDPVFIQRFSDHKVFLQDWEYPGHTTHPEHAAWLKTVKQNISEHKLWHLGYTYSGPRVRPTPELPEMEERPGTTEILWYKWRKLSSFFLLLFLL